MPRKFGSVNVEIWNDPEFRALPPAAQHLYLLLWTAPNLSFCGVHEWRPGRLIQLSQGFSEEHLRAVADCLVAHHFLVIDEATEEVLVRSWARFDGLLKQPKLAISYTMAYSEVWSTTIRQVLAHETRKMQEMWPELGCWKDQRLKDILGHEAVSAKDLPVPNDPLTLDLTPGFTPAVTPGLTLGLAQTRGKANPSVNPPPTPAPTPAPNTLHREEVADAPARKDKSKPAIRLPGDWKPTSEHADRALAAGIDLHREAEKFKAHAEANDRKLKNWNAGFTKWLVTEEGYAANRGPARVVAELPHVDDIAQPPDGLTDEQYRNWWDTQRSAR